MSYDFCVFLYVLCGVFVGLGESMTQGNDVICTLNMVMGQLWQKLRYVAGIAQRRIIIDILSQTGSDELSQCPHLHGVVIPV